MVLCSAVNITKSYSEKILLKDISLTISEGDKIGVVGVNGAGKSTFLKIVAGAEAPDSGTVWKAGGLRIGYLPQNPVFEEDITILEQVFKGASRQIKEMKEHEAKTILTKLGLMDFDKDLRLLSGGEKKRVSIASALIHPSDLLILDEPTNHIDSAMVEWLEKYLQKYTGAILMVTHDRYFLDRVTNKIVEFDGGCLYSYDANYSSFLELKAQREEMEIGSERKRRSFLRRELEWMQRGARARSTKSKARIDRFNELSDKEGPAAAQKLDLSSVTTRLGKKTVYLNRISKSFEGKPIIRDFEYILLRDDRIGILGKNGCGKSTLLKLMCGKLTPDTGTVEIGDTVKIGYFSQECEEMDPSLRVIDYIREAAENIVTVDGTLTASQMLEKFLFPAREQYNTIGRLSGGERRRLFLLRTIMDAPNILLLDEPTNDLDITTLMILEDYLEGFNGAVVAVSHDRYFLNKIAERIFVFQNDATIKQVPGGYAEYLQDCEEAPKPPMRKVSTKKQSAEGELGNKPQAKAKFTFREQQEYSIIDSVIADLEKRLEEVKGDIEKEASNYILLEELLKEQETIEAQLHEKMERWLYLNDIAERILKNK